MARSIVSPDSTWDAVFSEAPELSSDSPFRRTLKEKANGAYTRANLILQPVYDNENTSIIDIYFYEYFL